MKNGTLKHINLFNELRLILKTNGIVYDVKYCADARLNVQITELQCHFHPTISFPHTSLTIMHIHTVIRHIFYYITF